MRVAVLKGGRSLERQVSLASGARVEDALERLGHDVRGIDAGHDLVARLREQEPDAVFLALHGRDGEDGTIQELLELLQIPYTGSGAGACMRCADKAMAKHLLLDRGLPTPDFFSFNESAFKELGAGEALAAVEAKLGFPVVVKPANQGSALGITFAQGAADLPGALMAAFSYADKALLEAAVAPAPARDLAVSVLEDEPLPVVEAIPAEGTDFYDFSARYTIGGTRFACPADLDAETTEEAQTLALQAHQLLGCHGFSRVDMMVDAEGELHLLEVNVIPGMTETSLLPQAADAAGIGFDELVARMLALT